jgi:hypothetical protein
MGANGLIRQEWKRRPWWMNLMFAFCVYMTFIYLPFDLFIKPVKADQEVWFGFMLTGWWAKATAPLHWLIYGSLAFGFWKMRRWMHPWAMVYTLQVAIGMGIWCVVDQRGPGPVGGLVATGVFMVPVIALWRVRHLFDGVPGAKAG